MTLRSDMLVAAVTVAGLAVGVLVGLLVGDARTFGGLGALVGLVVGYSVTALPPWARTPPPSSGRQRKR